MDTNQKYPRVKIFPKDLSKEQLEELKKEWIKIYKGKAGATPILWTGSRN